ncbi:hypothetical protein [Pseudomonas caspiana]|uniref:hypothetical protein n=1 Tax=Pseudomonas caspiana TaxID=1451454 RepID=UPI0032EFAB4E
MTSSSTPPVPGRAKRGAGVLTFNQAVVVGLPAHGVVPVTLLDPLVPLVVKIKNSAADFVALDQIQLHWNKPTLGGGFGDKWTVTDAQAKDPDFVYELKITTDLIPAEWMYEENQLEYEVGDTFSSTGAMSGKPVTVIFDRIIPGGDAPPALLTFTEEQAHEITEDDMVLDKLPVFAQAWYDMREGDVLTPWLGTGPLDADGNYLAPMPAVKPGEDHGRFPVLFERSDLVNLGNKEQYFAYKVEDLAGNVSQRSVSIHAFVFLANPPSGFLAPLIPAADDKVVTESDTRPNALDVEIPLYTNPAVGQEIVVVWGGVEMPGVFLDATHVPPGSGVPSDPLIVIPLRYEDVVKGGVKVSGLVVNYKVKVKTIVVGTSLGTPIDVDLTTPGGQPDPDPTTPWHEDLGLLTVQSSSGAPVNTIPARDYDKDAVITIPRTGVISTLPIWILGDEVKITYRSEELPVVPITASNEPNNLTVTLPAAVIGRGGPNPQMPVKYRIERALAGVSPAQLGTAYSNATLVDVSSSADFPNDGNPLRAVDFPEKKEVEGNYYIQRAEGRDGTIIHVPVNYSNVDNTSTIDLRFVGIEGFNNPSGADITGTEVPFTGHPITDADLVRGYVELAISAEILLKICHRNGSKTNYSITNGSGPTNSVNTFMNIAVQHKDPDWGCKYPVPPSEP